MSYMNELDNYNNGDIEENRPSFEDAIANLRANPEELSDLSVLYGLAGLNPDQLAEMGKLWPNLSPVYRQTLIQTMVDVSESQYELDYEGIALLALSDTHTEIRRSAIELLAESESLGVMHRLRDVLKHDSEVLIRAEAARALGRFVLMGEVGDVAQSHTYPIRQDLFALLSDSNQPEPVRNAALEAISNSSDTNVQPWIADAYRSYNSDTRRSAVVAMGHTCDERWSDAVLEELESADELIRIAAIRAAGELQLEDAVLPLARMLTDQEFDRETRLVIIWALGEIGGQASMQVLDHAFAVAEEEDDDEMLIVLEEALGNSSLLSGDLHIGDFSFED